MPLEPAEQLLRTMAGQKQADRHVDDEKPEFHVISDLPYA
jgi:hypothetical protein